MRGLFLFWIILELVVFYAVAVWLGLLVAILLVLASFFVGLILVRTHSMGMLQQAQFKIQSGEMPALEIIESVAVMLGGLFMMVPGFLSTLIGLVLVIPGLRRGLAWWLLSKRILRFRNKAGQPGSQQQGRVIDGESWHND